MDSCHFICLIMLGFVSVAAERTAGNGEAKLFYARGKEIRAASLHSVMPG